jgi:hypothetical protein
VKLKTLEYIAQYGEATYPMLRSNCGAHENEVRKLYLKGTLVRRQVTPEPNSSRVVWAYRLPDQPEDLPTYPKLERDPISNRPVKKARVRTKKERVEPDYSVILRRLGC